jgi:PA14 domain
MKTRKNAFRLSSILFLIWGLISPLNSAIPAIKPLALHPENPHYFLFRGKPTILITSGEHYGAVLNLDFNYKKYLETLERAGMNHTRVFTGAAYVEPQGSFNIAGNTLAPASGRYIAPWARSSTPGYAGGGNRFDLSKWDEDYFRRIKAFMTEARQRGIIIEVNLFCPFYGEKEWERSPFKASNNINGFGNIPRQDVYTLDKNDRLLEVQERFVRRIVRELIEFDNLYYEVCNEPYAGNIPINWQNHIVDVIVDAEKGVGWKHLISLNISNGSQKVEDPHPAVSIFNFHYASPAETVALNYGLNKVIGDNETGFRGTKDDPYRMEGWEFIMAGGALYNNLDYSFTVGHEDGTFVYPDTQPGGGTAALRSQLRILRNFIYGFDFLKMKPDNSVIKGGVPEGHIARALVEHGKSYAIYMRPMSYGQFSARWTGSIEPRFSEEYTFYTRSNDGVRLWIDDKLIIDNWTDHAETEDAGKIALEAGKKYRLKLEYFYAGGWGVTRLFWSSAGEKREIVTTNDLKGEYFSGIELKNPVLTRKDDKIDFTWGNGLSPFAQSKSGVTTLHVDLPDGKYRAEWVDTKSGEIAKSEELGHKGGVRKLIAPEYKDDIALRIRK